MLIYTTFLLFLVSQSNGSKIGKKIDEWLAPPSPSYPNSATGSTDWLFSKDTQPQPKAPLDNNNNQKEAFHPPTNLECDPCNKEPWIPIVSNYGSSTMIGFVQPSEITKTKENFNYNSLQSLNPPGVNQVYGAPNGEYGVPQGAYGPPKPVEGPLNTYGLPKPQNSIPFGEYGPPKAPNGEYGPPKLPNNDYGPPKVPIGEYGPPKAPHSEYGPPKLPHGEYGPPKLPNNDYGPPKVPIGEYGPPKGPHSEYGPPKLPHGEYGPPKVHTEYGPPKAPHSEYGPPVPNGEYGPPKVPKGEYGPPKVPKGEYGPPKAPHNEYGPPKVHQNYGPPQNSLGPPPYGAPKPPNLSYRPPNPGKGPIGPHFNFPPRGIPPGIKGPPIPLKPPSPPPFPFKHPRPFTPPRGVNNLGPRPRPPPRGIPIGKLQPTYGPPSQNAIVSNYGSDFPSDNGMPHQNIPSQSSFLNLGYGVPPNPPLNHVFDSHGPQIELGPTLPNQEAVQFDHSDGSFSPPFPAVPPVIPNFESLPPLSSNGGVVDSYGPPPAGPVNPDPNGADELYPPIASTQNHVVSSDGINHHENLQKLLGSTEGLQVIPSIAVGDFIQSIQYPPNVVQSPVIDLSKGGDFQKGPIYSSGDDSFQNEAGSGNLHESSGSFQKGTTFESSSFQSGPNFGSSNGNIQNGPTHSASSGNIQIGSTFGSSGNQNGPTFHSSGSSGIFQQGSTFGSSGNHGSSGSFQTGSTFESSGNQNGPTHSTSSGNIQIGSTFESSGNQNGPTFHSSGSSGIFQQGSTFGSSGNHGSSGSFQTGSTFGSSGNQNGPNFQQGPIYTTSGSGNSGPSRQQKGNGNLEPIIVEEDYHEASNSKHTISIHNGTSELTSTEEKLNGIEGLDKVTKSIIKDLLGDSPEKDFLKPQPFSKEENENDPKTKGKNEGAIKTNNGFQAQKESTTWEPYRTIPKEHQNQNRDDFKKVESTTWEPYRTITTELIRQTQKPFGNSNSWIQKVPKEQIKPPKKQIQIIVPYITSDSKESKTFSYKEPLPFMTAPKENLGSASKWTKYTNSEDIRKVPISNIQDILASDGSKTENFKHLPFDIIKFQKNIDVWTEQEYNTESSNHLLKITKARLNHTKQIPEEYLSPNEISTLSYSHLKETSTKKSKKFLDHEAAGSIQHLVQTNKVEPPSNGTKLSWDKVSSKLQVTISPVTKEKVYVVTPSSLIQNQKFDLDLDLKESSTGKTGKFPEGISNEGIENSTGRNLGSKEGSSSNQNFKVWNGGFWSSTEGFRGFGISNGSTESFLDSTDKNTTGEDSMTSTEEFTEGSTNLESLSETTEDSLERTSETNILSFTSPRFKQRPQPEPKKFEKKGSIQDQSVTQVPEGIFSQLSKLISELETTTPDALTNHPLLGKMSLPKNIDRSDTGSGETTVINSKETTFSTTTTTERGSTIKNDDNKIQR